MAFFRMTAQGPVRLDGGDGRDAAAPAPYEQHLQGSSTAQRQVVRVVVQDNAYLVELLHAQLLLVGDDGALLVYSALQRSGVPLPEVQLIFFVFGHSHDLVLEVLDGLPGVVQPQAGREDVDALEAAASIFFERCP